MRRDLQPEDLGDFLGQSTVAILATRSPNGTTLLAPVWHEWSDGGFTFVTFTGDVKLRHIESNPRVSLAVAEDTPPYRGIEVRGDARIDTADGPSTLRRLAERYLKGRDVDAYMEKISRWMEDGPAASVVVRVEPGS